MKLKFTKMHGAGNDFIVIDAINQTVNLTPDQWHLIADRRFGIGADQMLVVEKPTTPDVDFRYRIFNADGSEVSQCGNGARCFARFVRDRRLTRKDTLRVETASGIITLQIDSQGWVTVDMGPPRLEPNAIPFVADNAALDYRIEVDGELYQIAAVSMGNPHAVLRVDDADSAPVATLGPRLESHPRFPERVNVGFMQVINRQEIKLRVYERGTGETLACGTGACAAAVAAMRWGLVDRDIKVHLPGGSLRIRWSHDNASVLMTGPTARVFDGTLRVNDVNDD